MDVISADFAGVVGWFEAQASLPAFPIAIVTGVMALILAGQLTLRALRGNSRSSRGSIYAGSSDSGSGSAGDGGGGGGD